MMTTPRQSKVRTTERDQGPDGDRGGRVIRRIRRLSKDELQHQRMRAAIIGNRCCHRTRPFILSTVFLILGLSTVFHMDFSRHLSSPASWCCHSSTFFAVAQEHATKTDPDDVEDEYLRAVLEEERQQHMQQNPYDNAYSDEADYQAYQEKLERRAQEEELRLATEKERLEKQELLRIQQEREAAFERELQMAATEQHKKKLQQQRRKDHALVRQVRRAAQRGDLYRVLGLRNWQFQMGGWCWNIPWFFWPRKLRNEKKNDKKNSKCLVKFPTWRVFGISSQDIRRAYRARALLVHPDKNRDARAQEAFVAVEEAAGVLTNEATRKDYDAMVTKDRKERLVQWQHRVQQLVHVVSGNVRRILKVMRTVLGPFTVPILVLGGILI
jgi:hypothetical protein